MGSAQRLRRRCVSVTSRVDVNNARDFPGSPRGGDVLPSYNRPGQTTTPASGSGIRDDGPAARTAADTAATLTRLEIDSDVAEATGGLRSQKGSGRSPKAPTLSRLRSRGRVQRVRSCR